MNYDRRFITEPKVKKVPIDLTFFLVVGVLVLVILFMISVVLN